MIPQLSNWSLTCKVRTILSRVVFCSGSRSWEPPCSMRMISEHASSSVLREGWGLSPPFSITSNSSSSHLVLVSFSCETFVFVMTTCPASERNYLFFFKSLYCRDCSPVTRCICSFHCLRYTSSDFIVNNQWWLVSHGILVWKSNNHFELRVKHKYEHLMDILLYMYTTRQLDHSVVLISSNQNSSQQIPSYAMEYRNIIQYLRSLFIIYLFQSTMQLIVSGCI